MSKQKSAAAKAAAEAAKGDITLYELLNVAKSASAQQIRSAYRKRALKLHPDKIKAGESVEEATKKFTELRAAFTVLSDEECRREYDALLEVRMARERQNAAREATKRQMRENLEHREKLASEQYDRAKKDSADIESLIREQNMKMMRDLQRRKEKASRAASQKSSTSSSSSTVRIASNDGTKLSYDYVDSIFQSFGKIDAIVMSSDKKQALIAFVHSFACREATDELVKRQLPFTLVSEGKSYATSSTVASAQRANTLESHLELERETLALLL